MEDYGLFRVAAAVPCVKVADIDHNMKAIVGLIDKAETEGASLVVFPELSVTGYTCGDLFSQDLLLRKAEEAVAKIMAFTRGKFITVIVGVPVQFCGKLYNCAAVIRNGGLKGLVPKYTCLPTANSTRLAGSLQDRTSCHSTMSPAAISSMTGRGSAAKDSTQKYVSPGSSATFLRTSCSR